MNTRLGHAGDFKALLPMMRQYRLRQQQFDPELYKLHPDAEQRFSRWAGAMAEDPRATLLVAEAQPGGELIGFLYVTIEKDAPIYVHDEYALIREWWVESAFRELGAGQALVSAAATKVAEVGVRQLRVRVPATDVQADSLLQSCGFRPGASELVMELPQRRQPSRLGTKRSRRTDDGV